MTLVLNGTTGVSAVDGSAATPAIQGNDSNTGIFFPAADTIAFAEGGAEVARFDSSGNFGLGVTPSAWRSGSDKVLQIGQRMAVFADSALTSEISNNQYIAAGNVRTYIASDFATRYEQWQGQHRWFTAPSGTAGNAINFTQAMTLDTSGNLLVGQTSASGTATGSTDIYAGGLIINPNNRTSSGSANCVWSTPSGAFFRSTSSIKYKINVENAAYGLAQVMQLRPVTYQSKSEIDGDKRFGGFIAEEVDEIGLTEFVVYDESGAPDALGYDRMVSLLTKAIQEQQALIESLTARIAALEAA